MTPKEKAIDLVEDMHDAPEMGYNEHAKQCALIAVDEIIKSKPHEWDGCDYYSMEDYWKQVLIEINKL
jgi:hypothetical protein